MILGFKYDHHGSSECLAAFQKTFSIIPAHVEAICRSWEKLQIVTNTPGVIVAPLNLSFLTKNPRGEATITELFMSVL